MAHLGCSLRAQSSQATASNSLRSLAFGVLFIGLRAARSIAPAGPNVYLQPFASDAKAAHSRWTMLIRPIDALLPRLGRQFGGKATGLAALVRAGFPVPAAYALAREAADEVYARVLPGGLEALTRLDGASPNDAARAETLARARERIMQSEIPQSLARELSRTLGLLRGAAAESVAVRSSSTMEDHALASAAGLFSTTLNVRDELSLANAVRQAWASLLSPAALSYAAMLGSTETMGMGVVIQAMVPADAAGVLFTANPLTGDTDEMVVHASLGLGTQVTDGNATPDTFRIDKRSGFVRDRVIAEKRTRIVLSERGGLAELLVQPFEAHVQALDEHVLAQLTVLGRRIEEHFGEPRDIEFAVAGDTVYVLQSRPVSIAGLPRSGARAPLGGRFRRASARRGPSSDPSRLLWSNLNVGEVLPGVATPLTWSVLSGFAELGFREALAALGCKAPKGARLLGSFRGRIFLNVTELDGIAAQVPGLRAGHVLPLIGAGYESMRPEPGSAAPKQSNLLMRLPGVASRFVASHLGFEQRVERFEASFAFERARIERLDLRILPGAALDETLADVERLLAQTAVLLAQAYGGLIAALLPLRAALDVLVGKEAAQVQRAFLSAIEDVASAGPGREVIAAANAFAQDEPAREQLLREGGERLGLLPPGPARAAIERLIERYGHRAGREAELAEPRWRESPRFLLDAVRLQLVHGVHDTRAQLERRLEALREQADAALRTIPSPARPPMRALLSVVRRYVRRREQLRSHVAHVLFMCRRVALDASRRMLVREPELGADPAFMLSAPELHAFLRGELRSVRALVALRRRQYARDLCLPEPPDTFVGYPPAAVAVPAPAGAGAMLSGLAASSGAVEGRVRVLRSPEASLEPGEILVVTAADVGWTPLFVLAGGLVSELGGPLSHACIVAREYGLPAVVSVRSATRTLKTGDRVRVDGSAGTVELLSHA
jgi:pyruvate,water dikinase